MANSDKNILITPSVGLSTNPTIRFSGANNTPTTLRVLDDGTISFEGTAGQLFSISDGLTGSIFSVNDISGIPSIEVLDTGLVKLNQYGGSTVFGTSAAIQNSSSVNAKVSISTASASTPGLIVKASSSQTAHLIEWQNSSGTTLGRIDAEGSIYSANRVTSPGDLTANTRSFFASPSFNSATVNINTAYTTQSGIVIRGVASQTANLQEWQDSAGTVVSSINAAGYIYPAGGIKASVYGYIYTSNTQGSVSFLIADGNAGYVPLVIKGVTSQTADLQQWKNSSGTLMAAVKADGSFRAGGTNGATKFIVDQFGTLSLGADRGANPTYLFVQSQLTTDVGAVIKGAASQTGDLQQWQDSNSNILAKVTYNGVFVSGTSSASTSGIQVGSASFAGVTWNGISNPAGVTTLPSLVVKGITSQTGNLQEWQDSAGTVLTSITPQGFLKVGATGVSGVLGVMAVNAGIRPLVVQGYASQTADLTQWTNNAGAVLAKVASDGGVTTPNISLGTYGGIYAPGSYMTFNTADMRMVTSGIAMGNSAFGPTAQLHVVNGTAANPGLIVKAAASQTANIQEWHTGTGYISAYISSAGQFETNYFYTNFGGGNYKDNGLVTINPANNIVPLVIAGASGQTSNLQEWKNSAGTVLIGITSTGNIYSGTTYDSGYAAKLHIGSAFYAMSSNTPIGGIYISSTNSVSVDTGGMISLGGIYSGSTHTRWAAIGGLKETATSGEYGGYLSLGTRTNGSSGVTERMRISSVGNVSINGFTASTVGLTVKGAASQTASLQEWQSSTGNILLKVNSNGSLQFGDSSTNTIWFTAAVPYSINWGTEPVVYGGTTPNTTVIAPYSSDRYALTVRGRASQTADLQQWQNSSGTTLAKVDKDGNVNTTKSFVQTGTIGTTYAIDASGNQATYAANATVDFPNFSGMILIDCQLDGALSLWLCGGGSATRIGGSKTGGYDGAVAHNSGINGYTWTNANTSQNVNITAIRVRSGA